MATPSPSSTLAAVVIGATGATGKCLVQTLLTAKVAKLSYRMCDIMDMVRSLFKYLRTGFPRSHY